jgi:hypothetical protein
MMMFFPRRVQLTLPSTTATTTLYFNPGLQEVPDELAYHWWLKAHGVTLAQIAMDKPTPPNAEWLASMKRLSARRPAPQGQPERLYALAPPTPSNLLVPYESIGAGP